MLTVGTYKLDLDMTYRIVKRAIEIGYREFDTASLYKNEEAVGNAVRDSGVPREEIWVTTKIWITDIKKDRIHEAINESLLRLGLDYVDLVLIHAPVKDKIESSWLSLEGYLEKNQDKVRHIGVSNYNVTNLEKLEKIWKIKPYCNQIEVSPMCRREDVVLWCQARKIGIYSYSCLGKGILINHQKIQDLTNITNVKVPSLLIGWQRYKKYHVIIGTSSEEHLMENWNDRNLVLQEEVLEKLDQMQEQFSLFPRYL